MREERTAFCLEASDIAFTHEGSRLPAFEKVGFSIASGEVMGLGGVNGSGKSSLLAVVAGLYAQDSGEFYFSRHGGGLGLQAAPSAPCDENGTHNTLRGEKSPAGQRLRRREASLLMQDANMQIFGATVGEDILLARPDATENDIARARGLAARLGLAAAWDIAPDRLSYGQKRKLCLASALFEAPGILLLDEPFSGLDYPASCELLRILEELKGRGMAVIVSTHDFGDILPLMDSLLLLPARGEGAEKAGEPFFGPAPEGLPLLGAYGLKPIADSP